jgi:hypothetical protein
MRTILAVFVSIFVFVGPGWAQDVTAIKVPFNVSTSGNFAQVVVHYAANPQVIAGLGLAGCLAYLEDPTCWKATRQSVRRHFELGWQKLEMAALQGHPVDRGRHEYISHAGRWEKSRSRRRRRTERKVCSNSRGRLLQR